MWFDIAVVGAHLEGMPLHGDLVGLGARMVVRTATTASYRLYALPGAPPARPALVRVAADGSPIEVEVYRLHTGEVGAFLASAPPPLAIGSVHLASGTWVHGFVCEPIGLQGAEDISWYGGWRAYVDDRADDG